MLIVERLVLFYSSASLFHGFFGWLFLLLGFQLFDTSSLADRVSIILLLVLQVVVFVLSFPHLVLFGL